MRKPQVVGLALALAAGSSLAAPAVAAPNGQGNVALKATTTTTATTTKTSPTVGALSAAQKAQVLAHRRGQGDHRRRYKKRPRPTYEAQKPTATVNQAVVRRGTQVGFWATGFPRSSDVKIWVEGPNGARIQINGGQNGIIVKSDRDGNVWANVAGFRAGKYRIIISGGSDWDKDIYAEASFTVTGGRHGKGH